MGKKDWKKYPTEDEFKSEEQLSKACFGWFDKTFGLEFRGLLHLNFNNPKDKRQGNILKGQGLRAGHPDMTLEIPLFEKRLACLHIELKLSGTGVVSAKQVAQMAILTKFRNKCVIVCSLKQFQEIVLQWIELYRSEC
jgi:hypothetical protein